MKALGDIYLYPLVGLWGVLFLVSIIGNTLVCLRFARRNQLLGMKPFYFCSLAIADLIFTIATLFYVLNTILPNRLFEHFSCKMFYYIINTSHGASVLNLLLLTYSRYMAVTRPLKAYTQSQGVAKRVGGVWVLALLPYAPLWHIYSVKSDVRLHNGHCEQKMFNNDFISVYYALVIVLMYCAPLACMCTAYVRISTHLRDRNIPNMVNNYRKRAFKLLVTLALLLFILWTPFNVMLFLIFVLKIDFKYRELLWGVSSLLILLNSSLNPWLYIKASRTSSRIQLRLKKKQRHRMTVRHHRRKYVVNSYNR
ncbi:QRFP-like peptide receptor [Nematostella vectensis]|uniref:QRFP-like peptide receptor n=1 Tax=Nematostella vectensis TaxID=45351 RepID=UPI0020773AEB|nr:QRFP-like peptide receptor [Nematostella vectensis]